MPFAFSRTASVILAVLSPFSLVQANTETDYDVLVISASQQAENWLTTPASIEHRSIQQYGLQSDSSQLLRGLSGLQADNRANFAQDTRLSLRGFGSRSAFGIRGLHLQQDGIPLVTPDGQGQLSGVLLDDIAYVEVLKGPLAALYGNSSGGVISLYSNTPSDNALSLQLAGSSEHRQQRLKGQWSDTDTRLSFSAKRFTSDGFRPHSSAEKQQFQAMWLQELTPELQLTIRADWASDPKLQDPAGLTYEQWQQNPEQTDPSALRFNTTKTIWQRQLSASLARSADSPWQIASWYGQRRMNQRLAFTGSAIGSAGGEIALERYYKGVNGHYQWQLSEPLSLTSGASLVNSTDQRQGFVNDFGQRGELRRNEQNKASNTDIFSRIHWQWHPDWQFQGGWRHSKTRLSITDYFVVAGNPDDSGHKRFSENAVAGGINYRINNNLSWSVTAGTGFETPTLTEIAYRPDGNGLNLALNASRNYQQETTLKWQHEHSSASLTLFNINTSDELVVDVSTGGRTTYRNAGKTQRQGIELQALWQISPLWQHQFSGHYLDARYSNGNYHDNRLPGIARLQLYWDIGYKPFADDSLLFSIRPHYRGNMAVHDNNELYTPSAVNIDFSVQLKQQWQQWQFSQWLEINNLTDKKYIGSVIVNQSAGRYFEPATGTQLSAGIMMQYLW